MDKALLDRDERLQEFLERLSEVEVLTLDTRGAELAGKIYADLERTGQPSGRSLDFMLAC